MKIALTCIGVFGLICFTTCQEMWIEIPNHNEEFLLTLEEEVNSLTEARQKCADRNAILLPFWRDNVAANLDQYLLGLISKS